MQKDYYHEALDQLEELIEGLKELGTFQMKSREDFIDKVRHTTLLDEYYASEIDKEVIDVSYNQIETSIYFTEKGTYLADYVEYWDEDGEEYEYCGTWFKEQERC